MPQRFALVGHVEGYDADPDRLPVARAQHRMQLDQHAAAGDLELDVMRVSRVGGAQPVGERGGQLLQRVVPVVRRHGKAVEPGQRVVHAHEARLRVAQAQPERHVPDGVEQPPCGGLLDRSFHRHPVRPTA